MDDLISRKATGEMVGDIWLSCSNYKLDIDQFYELVVSAIENEIPSVQTKMGQWISTSERLPEENDVYLVALNTLGYPKRAIDGFMSQTKRKWEEYGDKVVAWMPLPEPWKGDDDNANND